MKNIFASFTTPFTIDTVPAGKVGDLAIIQNSKGHHYLASWFPYVVFGIPAGWRPLEGNEVDPNEYRTVFAVLLGYDLVRRDPYRPGKWAFDCTLVEAAA
jgi:hypothetical protein